MRTIRMNDLCFHAMAPSPSARRGKSTSARPHSPQLIRATDGPSLRHGSPPAAVSLVLT